MPPQRRKMYLRDPNAPVPRTTEFRRFRAGRELAHNREQQHHQEDQVMASDSDSTSDDSSANSESSQGVQSDNESALSDSSESQSDVSSQGVNVADDDNESLGGNSNGDDDMHVQNASESDNDGEDMDNDQPEVNGYVPPVHNVLNDQGDEEDLRGPPLYQGCPLSAVESDILVMSYVIRWGLEESSIEHLLQLIDCHLPVPVMGSQWLFLEKFKVPDLSYVRYTCSNCLQLLPRQFLRGQCPICGEQMDKDKLRASDNFFVELSITKQLKSILENESVFPLLRRESGDKDVISGRVYRHLRGTGLVGANDITLQWNTDGVSPYKTSKVQVWPIQACINELPYRARRENMILCGLYFGAKKPHFNSFLRPFVDELNSLHHNGFLCTFPGQGEETLVKVHTILGSVDSIARPSLQGIKQFNGSYGCSFCLRRGMKVDRGNGVARVYAGLVGRSRSIVQHLEALQSLQDYNARHRRQRKHWDGVKNASVLLPLAVFNIATSFVPDYMHCVLEGVVKQFINHWSDSAYDHAGWYLNKAKRTLISERLKAILPPVEITRASRGLDDVKLMKASEFRHFLLYYSLVCLKGILPDRYLKHWFLLVYGMSMYLKENFSQDEAVKAKQALNKFVAEIDTLYPDCFHLYTFNVHLLLHIPRAVENFGGLWASSTFPYEHFNGTVAKLITGPRTTPDQVCRSYLRLRCIARDGFKLFSQPNCSVRGKKLFMSLMSSFRSSQFSQNYEGRFRLFGTPDEYRMSLIEKVSAQRLLGEGPLHTCAQSFRRMIFQGTVYHACSYEALRVRNNSIVKLDNGRILSITRILLVEILRTHERKCIVFGEEFDELDETLCQYAELNLSSNMLLHVCHRSNRIVSAFPTSICRKCITIPYGDGECVIPLVNLLERD